MSILKDELNPNLPLVFGFLGCSQKLLDVFGDLLRLADDVLGARQRGVLLALLPRLHGVRRRKWAATNKKTTALKLIPDSFT